MASRAPAPRPRALVFLATVLSLALAPQLPGLAHAQAPPLQATTPNLSPATEIFPICKTEGVALVNLSAGALVSVPWRGWGTSLAWFANYVGGLPEAESDNILDLLFSENRGLGLNIVRFNIPGGYNATLSPQFLRDNVFKFRTNTGYRPQQDGPYDWAADAAQRRLLLGARARGADTFTAASYSPPWWATVSGDVAGNTNRRLSNLKPGSYGAYADYLTEVVRHYTEVHGIQFDALEPSNEPNDGGWGAGNTQEGCWLGIPELSRLFPLVAASLQEKGLEGVKLAVTNAWALTDARNLARFSPEVLALIQRVDAHGYINIDTQNPWLGPEFHYGSLRSESTKLGKEVWQTEWTFLRQAGADLDLGMVMARAIMEAVNYMEASAWVYWQAVDTTPRFTLINLTWDLSQQSAGTPVVTKKWWVLKQFAQFAKPGCRALIPRSSNGCEHCTTAFFDARTNRLALFVVNQEAASRPVSVSLQDFAAADPAAPVTVNAYRTSLTENMADVGPITGGTNPLMVDAPGRSLTTIVFENVNAA